MSERDRSRYTGLTGAGQEALDQLERAHQLAPAMTTDDLAALVNEQAEDGGLWFIARTAPEAYLQQELRRLHTAIEALAIPSPEDVSPKPSEPRTVLDAERLRDTFLRLLTTDSVTKDRRRREFNQAIFNTEGWAVFNGTDLGMVMSKFDRAARRCSVEEPQR